ncbi:MAG TPA: IPT/TIG domain-containing protein, partial [Bryobacteraceae bacterium]|nr:IPT/TIG domain-containing protein [Bryobacteraceae bacterium]
MSGLESPRAMALDASGDLYFVETAGRHVRRLNALGTLTSFAEGSWIEPSGIALGSAGDFFVADAGLNAIVHIDSGGNAAIVAGTGAAGFSGDAGPALAAQLNSPWDLSTDAGGALDIADLANDRVRQLVPQPAAVVAPTITLLNAASLESGPIAPGMLVQLMGTGLGASDAPNTQVMFGNFAAPIVALNSSQFLVEVPPQIGTLSSVSIQVLDNGNLAGQASATVAPAAPALYAGANGEASAINQDGTLNSPSNPALLGSIMVLYGTGEGVTGLPVTVTVGGYPAQILYSGPAAGYAGLWQINIVLPSGYIAPGNLGVVANAGGFSTQAGVTISVQ